MGGADIADIVSPRVESVNGGDNSLTETSFTTESEGSDGEEEEPELGEEGNENMEEEEGKCETDQESDKEEKDREEEEAAALLTPKVYHTPHTKHRSSSDAPSHPASRLYPSPASNWRQGGAGAPVSSPGGSPSVGRKRLIFSQRPLSEHIK